MKFSIKGFFSKYDQIRSFLRIWSLLLKKSLMENFIFCAVYSKDIRRRFYSNKASDIDHKKQLQPSRFLGFHLTKNAFKVIPFLQFFAIGPHNPRKF